MEDDPKKMSHKVFEDKLVDEIFRIGVKGAKDLGITDFEDFEDFTSDGYRTQHYKEDYYIDERNVGFPIRDMNDRRLRDAIKELTERISRPDQEVVKEMSIQQLKEEQDSRKFLDRLKKL